MRLLRMVQGASENPDLQPIRKGFLRFSHIADQPSFNRLDCLGDFLGRDEVTIDVSNFDDAFYTHLAVT
jgi:hypothetical protein